jgi:hypothetical protein
MSTNRIQQTSFPANTILHGNCIDRMRSLPNNSIAFILTDPPYLVRYQDRAGRSIRNDSNADWLKPAFAEAYRVLKQDRLMVAFYTWTHVDKFLDAWRGAGLRAVGHLVFRKQYASKAGFLKYQHEQAYLLAKGAPALPECPKQDVHAPWSTGNFGGELILTCSGTGSSRGVDPEFPLLQQKEPRTRFLAPIMLTALDELQLAFAVVVNASTSDVTLTFFFNSSSVSLSPDT